MKGFNCIFGVNWGHVRSKVNKTFGEHRFLDSCWMFGQIIIGLWCRKPAKIDVFVDSCETWHFLRILRMFEQPEFIKKNGETKLSRIWQSWRSTRSADFRPRSCKRSSSSAASHSAAAERGYWQLSRFRALIATESLLIFFCVPPPSQLFLFSIFSVTTHESFPSAFADWNGTFLRGKGDGLLQNLHRVYGRKLAALESIFWEVFRHSIALRKSVAKIVKDHIVFIHIYRLGGNVTRIVTFRWAIISHRLIWLSLILVNSAVFLVKSERSKSIKCKEMEKM